MKTRRRRSRSDGEDEMRGGDGEGRTLSPVLKIFGQYLFR